MLLLLCVAFLALLHRDDVRQLAGFHKEVNAAGDAEDPAAPCMEQRFAEVDGMIDEGVIGAEQAAMFKQRAEAMCRATEGGGGGPPLPVN